MTAPRRRCRCACGSSDPDEGIRTTTKNCNNVIFFCCQLSLLFSVCNGALIFSCKSLPLFLTVESTARSRPLAPQTEATPVLPRPCSHSTSDTLVSAYPLLQFDVFLWDAYLCLTFDESKLFSTASCIHLCLPQLPPRVLSWLG